MKNKENPGGGTKSPEGRAGDVEKYSQAWRPSGEISTSYQAVTRLGCRTAGTATALPRVALPEEQAWLEQLSQVRPTNARCCPMTYGVKSRVQRSGGAVLGDLYLKNCS